MAKKINKVRLDVYVTEKKLTESRELAKRYILAGKVKVNGNIIDKAGQMIPEDAEVILDIPEKNFVSRGGLKLDGALEEFKIDVKDFIAVDIGSSTGGFTDCLLQRGAAKVYAFDVGYGQLHYKLRNDPRVILRENFNARFLTEKEIPEKADIAVMDVSFISVKKIWNNIKKLLNINGTLLSLIKPQFEAGRENVPRGGVIKKPETHIEVLSDILNAAYIDGWKLGGLIPSSIKGSDGNREYWILLSCQNSEINNIQDFIKDLKLDDIVKRAFTI